MLHSHVARTGITTNNPGITCSTTGDNLRSSDGTGIASWPSSTTENFSPRFWIFNPSQTPTIGHGQARPPAAARITALLPAQRPPGSPVTVLQHLSVSRPLPPPTP